MNTTPFGFIILHIEDNERLIISNFNVFSTIVISFKLVQTSSNNNSLLTKNIKCLSLCHGGPFEFFIMRFLQFCTHCSSNGFCYHLILLFFIFGICYVIIRLGGLYSKLMTILSINLWTFLLAISFRMFIMNSRVFSKTAIVIIIFILIQVILYAKVFTVLAFFFNIFRLLSAPSHLFLLLLMIVVMWRYWSIV